jgi:CBS domain-containing protein
VTDDAGDLCGILSERDIVRKLAETPGQTLAQSVEENMTRDVQTCAPQDALIGVLRQMTEGRFRHMPVVDPQGGTNRLCGMITIGDVIQFRLRTLEHEALQMKQLIVG